MFKRISDLLIQIHQQHRKSYEDPFNPKNLLRAAIFIVLWLGIAWIISPH
ncbi:hypothetical protein [Paenirhodobacter sp.]